MKDAIKLGRKVTDLRHQANAMRNAVEDLLDKHADGDAHFQETGECLSTIARFPADDPRHLAAQRRMIFISSWPHRLWRYVKLGLKMAARRVGQMVEHAAFVSLRLLLIVVFNFAAILLLFWLLSML